MFGTAQWYQKQNQDLELLRQGILTELGDLKPVLEDSKFEDQSDQDHHPIGCEGIKVFLSQLIEDELTEDFLICKVKGEQIPIDYVPIQHDEYFSQVTVSRHPVQTQASKRGDNIGLEDIDPRRQQQLDHGNQPYNHQTPNGYNNLAKSSLDVALDQIMANPVY